MRQPARDEPVAAAQRLLDGGPDRLRVVRVGTHGGVAGGLVHRRVGGGDDRHASRHRLDDRNAEALETRRVDERGGAPVEARELVVVDVAEPDHVGAVERRLRPPALRADDGERVAVRQRRGEQRLEVLARLERRHGEEVGAAEIGARPVGARSSTPG